MIDWKYFDHQANTPISLETDGCSFSEWQHNSGDYRFSIHPKGFRIFLPTAALEANDEYANSDPYSVEEGIDSAFHQRRIQHTIELARQALSGVSHTPQILDLGCGQGHITENIRAALGSVLLTGLDYSVSAIEYAHEHFPEIDFAVGDAYNCPYAPGFFDLVVCNNLWEHVPDPLFLLSRIRKILKPGGHLIISTPSRYRTKNLVRILRGKPVSFMSKHHVTEYTVGQIKEQLRYGGFVAQTIMSKPISSGTTAEKSARFLFSLFVSATRSHHQLEGTVFYLAREATTTS